MPLQIVRNDITKMKVDAIVNAANRSLLGGGGVDGCIHRAAGPALLKECRKLHGCETGNAKITGAGRLPCKYVIHAVGPVWRGGTHGEKELLTSCYSTALRLAVEHDCTSIAFPLISAGVYGYPKEQALQIAVDTISSFLQEQDIETYIVIFDKKSYQISESLFSDIAAYIDDRYVEEHTDSRAEQSRRMALYDMDARFGAAPAGQDEVGEAALLKPAALPESPDETVLSPDATGRKASAYKAKQGASRRSPKDSGINQAPAPMMQAASLDEALSQIDESFSEMLLRKIDEAGMTDAQCYKRANIDRKLFSKIRGNRLYKPSKPTALAFAIALELPLDETKDLLMKAGFALSHSSKFDIIVEYFIANENYNIFEINEALFAFDQNLLGA